MKKILCILLTLVLLAGCTAQPVQTTQPSQTETFPANETVYDWDAKITLSDESVGVEYSTADSSGVTTANDIVYYEAGHDETYGEGEDHEAHTTEEAAAHTVVHITEPGTYLVTGNLSAGQIAVDLGEEAEDDPSAVVTLVLDGVNIVNTVAPAVIFYNVYECGDKDDPSAIVDTSAAGANVILAEGSVNNIVGSHVARIYKPETVVDGNTDDAEKLHKYDAAFCSKMSMNIGGEGCLNITADNEGLDSELHLTINSGTISISSGNDGINTNCDGVSVTTINGGLLTIHVTGSTGEGDGIDSNGWLVINGGQVRASACATSGDAGIDSDMGIQINGGTVCATGNMLDQIENGGQTHAVFTFAQAQQPGVYTLKNADGETVVECSTSNAFQYLILSAPELTEGSYTLWCGDVQYQGMGGMMGGFMGGTEVQRPDWPEEGGDVEIPPQPTQPVVTQGEGQQPTPDMSEQGTEIPIPENPGEMQVPGEMPEGGAMGQMTPPSADVPTMPEGETMPQGMEVPQGGQQGGFGGMGGMTMGTLTAEFTLTQGANYFTNVQPV